jgi:NAD(P)H-dependent FMN reductase
MRTKPQNTDLLVVGICGSLRDRSYTRSALQVALEGAQEFGVRTDLIDLRDYNLVFCDGNQDKDAYPEDVHKLRSEVAAAQGIILGTPNYHGSFSGVLKNTLDLMGFDSFEGKMVGLVGVSGGSRGAADALNSLRAIGRALHAWVAPNQVSIAEAWKYFDDEGSLKDAGLENRIKDVGRQVARFAYLHSSEKVQEFLQEWERAPENPGG